MTCVSGGAAVDEVESRETPSASDARVGRGDNKRVPGHCNIHVVREKVAKLVKSSHATRRKHDSVRAVTLCRARSGFGAQPDLCLCACGAT